MSVHDELARINTEIERLLTIRDYLQTQTNGAAPVKRRPGRPRGARPQAGKVTIAVAAKKALERSGEPMRTPDLLVAVRKEGATCRDADSLYKTLARHTDFVKVGRGTWGLAPS